MSNDKCKKFTSITEEGERHYPRPPGFRNLEDGPQIGYWQLAAKGENCDSCSTSFENCGFFVVCHKKGNLLHKN